MRGFILFWGGLVGSLTALVPHDFFSENSFVESIKQIRVPGFDKAYNASIIPFNGGYILAFRNDEYKLPLADYLEDYKNFLGLAFLNEDFEVIDQPLMQYQLGCRCYDPRLFLYRNEPWIIYGSANDEDTDACTSSRLNLAKIIVENSVFKISKSVPLKICNPNKFEKNWVPFIYQDQIHLSYTMDPHVVLTVDEETGVCDILCKSKVRHKWSWGQMRGGTKSEPLGEEAYLNFFHSLKKIGKDYYYFFGGCLFLKNPPFEIYKISPKPIIHRDFYSAKKNPNICANVVYPTGFFIKEDKIFVIYGENDAAIKIAVLYKQEFLDSLVSINS